MCSAIDQGTTSSRAIVFNDHQQIVGMGRMEFTQHFPSSGWVEHVPEEIWATCMWSCKTALKKAGIAASEDIAAIGITNQRETTIVWDRATGKAIHNAIVWQDRRTAKICERAQEGRQGSADHAQDRAAARPLFLRRPRSAGSSTMCAGARKRGREGRTRPSAQSTLSRSGG